MKTKIAFIGNSESPSKLLQIFKKMTPNSSGEWGNIVGVDNYKDADFYSVIDYVPQNVRHEVDLDKCIMIGAHPETMEAYHNVSKVKSFKALDIAKERGFLEWWLNFDYTYLNNLQPIPKTKQLACIMSDANCQTYHTARREHLARFVEVNAQKVEFNLHGRINPFTEKMKRYYRGACGSYDPRGAASSGGNDHMSGKEQVLAEHRFVLEYDATGEHYMSERVADALLLWAMPVYWGGLGAEKYLPEGSFIKLDINGDGSDFIHKLTDETYEKALPDIAKARDIILNEWQIWPMVHKAIFSRFK